VNEASPKPLWRRLGASVLRIALAVLPALVLIQGFMYVRQDQMIFFRQPLADEMRRIVHKIRPDAEEIELKTADGHRLHGWFVRNNAGGSRAPALIYFGGNAEEVSGLALAAGELRGVSFVLFNYRGYGRSEGDPGESALFSEALAIYDLIAARPDVDKQRIVAMGRSLGSGVATYLASQRPVAAVVLVTPYDSMTAVAQAKYPFILVDLLLKHPFDSAKRARSIDVPLLALIAGADTVIPPRHAERLAAAWRGPVTSIVIEGADHNEIEFDARYWRSLRDFLTKNLAIGQKVSRLERVRTCAAAQDPACRASVVLA
jgi:fermentation-respiration switch protein FrsA (DUF1100 family)